jgi:hypothetical protein
MSSWPRPYVSRPAARSFSGGLPKTRELSSTQGRELNRLPRYHPDAHAPWALTRTRPSRLMPAPRLTVGEAGFLTGGATSAFRLQLRRDFQLERSSRLTPSRDR